MSNQVDVKFRLKQRKSKGSQSGNLTTEILITMRVTYLSMRLEFSTGYHIDALRWDQNAERAIGPNRDGQSADEINGGIMRLARNIRDAARMFEEMEKVPTLDQFRETFEKIRAEEQQHIADKKLSLEVVKTALRYSDAANLRKYDIQENHIEVTTIKTIDALLIDLNSHSRSILKNTRTHVSRKMLPYPL